MEWTFNDKKFLRSLGIMADETSPNAEIPLPRFVLMRGKEPGEFRVVDQRGELNDHYVGRCQHARVIAEDYARMMNAKYSEQQGEST